MEIKVSWHKSPQNIKERACETVGKHAVKPITALELWSFLLSEHSPIRDCEIKIEMLGIPSHVSTHFVRHVHSLHYVKTSRPDRTGVERSPSQLVNHTMICNLQALIDMMRKRLCRPPVVAKDTHEVALAIRRELEKYREDDPLALFYTVSCALVPNCVYRGGCPEGSKTCGFFSKYYKDTILERYSQYREFLDLT